GGTGGVHDEGRRIGIDNGDACGERAVGHRSGGLLQRRPCDGAGLRLRVEQDDLAQLGKRGVTHLVAGLRQAYRIANHGQVVERPEPPLDDEKARVRLPEHVSLLAREKGGVIGTRTAPILCTANAKKTQAPNLLSHSATWPPRSPPAAIRRLA